jgi:hypothetical protein
MNQRLTARALAGFVGVVFLIAGIIGFIPGIVGNYEDLKFAGHDSQAQLFHVFQTSILHNIVALLFGALGLVAARVPDWSRLFLIGGGVFYVGLWVYGLLIDKGSSANFIPVDRADDWLNFGIGVGMTILGLLVTRDTKGERSAAAT